MASLTGFQNHTHPHVVSNGLNVTPAYFCVLQVEYYKPRFISVTIVVGTVLARHIIDVTSSYILERRNSSARFVRRVSTESGI